MFPIERSLPSNVRTGKQCSVTIHDATLKPVETMLLAWETMLGDPSQLICGFKEPVGTVDDILSAKHKTVMEYVGFSITVEGFREAYLARLAALRAGFSVCILPTRHDGEDFIMRADVGCTLLGLYSWVKSGMLYDAIEHAEFVNLLLSAVEAYDATVKAVLEGSYARQ